LALFRDMEVTAGNIANANTTAYNSEHILFTSFLEKDVNQGEPNKMAFAYDISSYRNTQTGPIRTTGNPFDIAIQGPGYFMIDTPLGVRYTRNGSFQVNQEGALVTPEGYYVLDQSKQPVLLPEDTVSVDIGEAGN